MKDFQHLQRQLTDYLRDPLSNSGPPGVEPRRLQIYRELFFNNIEGFLSGGFPVCRSLFSAAQWRELVRDFMRNHRCQSPYFLQIAEEFLIYLNGAQAPAIAPPFLPALAHYEWVEMALDIADDQLPAARPQPASLLDAPLQRSVLAWPLAYPYAVQRISAEFQPQCADAKATYLLVYRNRADEVGFMELNAVTTRLLELLANPGRPRDCLAVLAAELGATEESLQGFALPLLEQFYRRDILYLAEVSRDAN